MPTLGSAFQKRLLPAATLHSVGQLWALRLQGDQSSEEREVKGTHQMLQPQS